MEKIKNVMVSVLLVIALTGLVLLIASKSVPHEQEENPVAESTVIELKKVEP